MADSFVADSFYVPLGDGRWRATVHTTGPWDATAQHGGPPSALLGRAMRRCEPREDMIIARFTCEILRPIPVGEISVAARLARPGRSVELLEVPTPKAPWVSALSPSSSPPGRQSPDHLSAAASNVP